MPALPTRMRFVDGGDGGHQHLRRRTDDGLVAVVLRNPETVVAQRLAVLRERNRVANGDTVRAVDDGDRLVED